MRALVVDDDVGIRRLVAGRLAQQGIDVATASTTAAGLHELRHASFDVAILDLGLPDGSGLDLLQALRDAGADTHVIMLTGAGDETDRILALDAGADDYVVKPFFIGELTARVLAVRRRRDLARDTTLEAGPLRIDLSARRVQVGGTELDLPAREFELLAFLAARPGHVFSRDELLRAVWSSAADWQDASTVTEHIRRLRLKVEPDPRHPRLLVTVRGAGYRFEPPEAQGAAADRPEVRENADASARLRHETTGVASDVTDAVIVTDPQLQVRSWNQAAERLYGWAQDEVLGRHLFDVVPFVGSSDARAALLGAVRNESRWFGHAQQVARDGSVVHVTASTSPVRDNREQLAVVLALRPTAGPQPAAVTEPGSDAQPTPSDIQRGIDGRQFTAYYQPVVSLVDDEVISVEALMRWEHPERGVLTPSSFMEEAEASGLIVELGRTVLLDVCTQASRWRRDGLDLEVAINISSRQLADARLFDQVTAALDASALDPGTAWLEVTETTLVEDLDQAAATLHRLAGIGLRVAIDDFGTGWASLTYLKQFPVHALKIDRSFVDDIEHDPQDAAIARSILSLGDELGLLVIAEGVETEAQRAALVALGCTHAQGYLFGRPVPAGDLPVHRVRRDASA